MINNRSELTGHGTVKSRDININTGSTNRNVILQIIKSLPEKYESKVIERSLSDGDLEWSKRLKLPRKLDSTLSSRRPYPNRGKKEKNAEELNCKC